MKSQIIKSILLIVLVLGLQSHSYISSTIKSVKVTAMFDGFNEEGYNFSYETDDDYVTITFDKVKEDLIKKFDLKGDTYVGEKFEVTYSVSTTEDDDEIYTLESLKLIEE